MNDAPEIPAAVSDAAQLLATAFPGCGVFVAVLPTDERHVGVAHNFIGGSGDILSMLAQAVTHSESKDAPDGRPPLRLVRGGDDATRH